MTGTVQNKKSNRIVYGGPPDPNHSSLLRSFAAEHLTQRLEAVCREYIVADLADGTENELLAQLIRLPFILKSFTSDERSRAMFLPTTQYWINGMLKCGAMKGSVWQRRFIASAPDIVWPLTLHNKRGATTWIVITDSEGGLRVPLFGRHIEFGRAQAEKSARLIIVGDLVTVQFREGGLQVEIPVQDIVGPVQLPEPTIEREGYQIRIYDALGDGRIQLQRRDPWLRVHWTGTNQRADGTDFFEPSLDQYPENYDPTNYIEAFNSISSTSPSILFDIGTFTNVIVPRTTKNARIAFTVSSRPGAMYIDDSDADDLIDNLIHENAHIKLHCIQMQDTLLKNFERDDARYKVAWRPDPRPLGGIFEGIYVFANVCEFRRKTNKKRDRDIARKYFSDLSSAWNIVEEHAEFTAAGEWYREDMRSWISDMRSDLEH